MVVSGSESVERDLNCGAVIFNSIEGRVGNVPRFEAVGRCSILEINL
jgi:hypothetical protein